MFYEPNFNIHFDLFIYSCFDLQNHCLVANRKKNQKNIDYCLINKHLLILSLDVLFFLKRSLYFKLKKNHLLIAIAHVFQR